MIEIKQDSYNKKKDKVNKKKDKVAFKYIEPN